MSKLGSFAILSVTAALSLGGPAPKPKLLFTVTDHRTTDPAISADGRRIYYWQDGPDLYLFDRVSRRFSRVLANTAGAGPNLALSRAGDRLAFTRSAEGGGDQQLWILSLDPATGLARGEPRPASRLAASAPAFSPDGRWIAFATPTSRTAKNLIVVPANGGPERIVTETQGDVWPIEWVRSDSIYFGISFQEKENALRNGVYRVSAAGGKPQLVLRTVAWGGYPGLSPDGRLLLGYGSTWDTVIVASAAGKRLQAYSPNPEYITPGVWSTGGKAVGSRASKIRVVRVVDLDNGEVRTVSDTAELIDPIWSPDGHRVATARRSPASMLVSDLATGARQSIPLENPEGIEAPSHWSPDGRLIAYRDIRGGINLIDPATSKVRMLVATSGRGPWARWRSDSRAILYGVEAYAETDSIRKIDIHEVTIDGRDRLLHTLSTRCGGANACGKIIDDSLMSTWTWSTGEYLVTNFRTRGAPRVVYARDGLKAPQVPPVPTFSSNGRWMAVRRQSSTDQSWSIELMHSDGTAHRSVPVSFPVTSGAVNPWISDDGSELIVASGGCAPNLSHSCPDTLTYHRVNVATGNATLIASLPHTERPANGMIDNGGRWLAYLHDVESRVDFYEFDFSDLLKVSER
jgi:Tol biopolymer transport system component